MPNIKKRQSTRKVKGKAKTSGGSSRGTLETAISVKLPTQKSSPQTELSEFSFLIYGDKKIGKTSLCSQFPAALLYAFEPGAKGLEVYQVDIPTWGHAKKYNEAIIKDGDRYENIVIDTGAIAYDRCQAYVCNELKIDHPGDLGYGKGWSALKKAFSGFHLDIMNNGFGLVVVAHEKIAEVTLPSGLEVNRIEPDMTPSALSFNR